MDATPYVAQVRLRWRSRTSGRIEVQPGTVVTFDDDDFTPEGERSRGELPSLANVLERGLFRLWVAGDAGDPETWSRDEMLEFLFQREILQADGNEWPHNARKNQLLPAVQGALARLADEAPEDADGADEAPVAAEEA